MGNTANNNWPYPESTDLVKDGATAIENLADAIDTTLGVFVPSNPGLTLINTTSFSGVTAQSVNNVFTTTYNNYLLTMNISCNTGADRPMIRLRVAGVDASTGYYQGVVGRTSGGVALDSQQNANTIYDLSNGTNLKADSANNFFALTLLQPATAVRTMGFLESSVWTSGDVNQSQSASFMHATATAYDGFTIQRVGAAGTFTGSLSVYGYNV